MHRPAVFNPRGSEGTLTDIKSARSAVGQSRDSIGIGGRDATAVAPDNLTGATPAETFGDEHDHDDSSAA
jgi:hypothetical protein